MEGYLGTTPVDVSTDPSYSAHGPKDWALLWIERYGGIDGDHHKAWVLDQIARILLGTPVIVTEARWANGTSEHRYQLAEPPAEYHRWGLTACAATSMRPAILSMVTTRESPRKRKIAPPHRPEGR